MANETISLEDLMKKRFLHEGAEVQLTGRYADKTERSRQTFLFEVSPVNYNGEKWKRWVRLTDLYEIHHPLRHKVEFARDLVDAVRRVKENREKGPKPPS